MGPQFINQKMRYIDQLNKNWNKAKILVQLKYFRIN